MNSYIVLPALVAGLCLAIIIVLLMKGVTSFAQRVFCMFFLSMGLWSVIIFAMRSSPDLEHAYSWERWVFPAIVFTAVFYYHFTVLYSGVVYPRFILIAGYIIAFTILIFVPSDLWFTGMQIKPYGFAPIWGKGFPLILFSAYFFVLAGVVNLAKKYRQSRSYAERNRYLYLIIGAVAQNIGAAFDILPTFGLPLYPGAIIANGIFCLVTGIAIIKFHLLDINLIIKKGTAYLLMSAVAALPYIGAIVIFYVIFNESVPVWASALILIGVAFGLQPVWRWIQGLTDRIFYQERYNFLQELENFSQERHNISDIKQISSKLVSLLARALRASNVHLLLATNTGDFEVISSVGLSAAQFRLESHSPIVTWLREQKRRLSRDDMEIIQPLQHLTEKEKKQITDIRAELFFPLKTTISDLTGILVLGEKMTGDPYSDEDESLVLKVASRISVELENALLYASEKTLREEIQKQNQQKTEFLHQVAHELKTPLTAIISSSELLVDDLPSTENTPQRRLIKNIAHSAWSMDKRISELLDFARMQTGNLRVNIQDVSVSDSLDEISSVLEVLFKNKDQHLKVEVPAGLPAMQADRDRFEQVLVNLLSNANKFSPGGSIITVRAKHDRKRIVIEVEDNATQLSDVEKIRLFEPYYRGEDADKRQRLPGLGLGLAISKKLVQMQNGEMWIDTREGKGNTFCFSVPASQTEKAEGLAKVI